jgi:CHAD domain-containing protein
MAGARKELGKNGAVRHARRLLKSARRAAMKLTTSDDEETLHRFRVRVRQLRAFLKSYRKLLGPKRVGKTCDRLGQLIDLTNTSRDLQVQLRWLDRAWARERLGPRARESARWMTKHLASDAAGPNMAEPVDLARRLKKTARRLDRELSRVTGKKAGAAPEKQDKAFARIAGRHILRAADRLEKLLGTIGCRGDQESAHRARLTAKRLRYNLEQMRKSVEDAGPAITDLRRLQDLLGELRDRQLLETEIVKSLGAEAEAWAGELVEQARRAGDEEAETGSSGYQARCLGLRDLLQILRHEQQVLHRRLERVWLADRGRANLVNTRRVGQLLSGTAEDTAASESAVKAAAT